jgi:hypothetical protein
MSRMQFCCCARMPSCPAANVLLPALVVKSAGLIMSYDWGNMITLTCRGMNEFEKEKIHIYQKSLLF